MKFLLSLTWESNCQDRITTYCWTWGGADQDTGQDRWLTAADQRRRGSATSYWELKLKERLMESVAMASATTEGGGRAAAQKRVRFG